MTQDSTTKMERFDGKKKQLFYIHWNKKKIKTSFNFQNFDPQFARTGLYVYTYRVPIGYIYVVILLHKKDNWANKSCMHICIVYTRSIAMQKFAFGSLYMYYIPFFCVTLL